MKTFLTWIHETYLERTTSAHRLALKAKRGIASQTIELHELAFDAENMRWLIPFKNSEGKIVNFQIYYPLKTKPNKLNLKGLASCLYGFEKLVTGDRDKIVFLCEGPFDAIALDYAIGAKHRSRYIIVASPGAFKQEWAALFKGYKVRALYDNDDGGRAHAARVQKLLGESGIAKELRILKWPSGFRDGYDINDFVTDPEHKDIKIVSWLEANCVKIVATPKLLFQDGRRLATEARPVDWPWEHRLRCGTYVSFSGAQGTFKSTIARDIAARYSRGLPMPLCDNATMPAGHVLYVYAEENRDEVEDGFEQAGGDFANFTSMPAQTVDGGSLNLLENLPEIEAKIKERGTRLVIIDGQNSVVGAPNISTDMLARSNVSNKLHHFAQRLNICLIGIRNEDREGRALGPQSFGDIGRCVMRATETANCGKERYLTLEWVKVSDTARENYPPIPYGVENLGGNRRKILWGKSLKADVKAALDRKNHGNPAK